MHSKGQVKTAEGVTCKHRSPLLPACAGLPLKAHSFLPQHDLTQTLQHNAQGVSPLIGKLSRFIALQQIQATWIGFVALNADTRWKLNIIGNVDSALLAEQQHATFALTKTIREDLAALIAKGQQPKEKWSALLTELRGT